MTKVNREVLIGHVAVDSGQLMLCDPCYLDKWQDNEEWEKVTADESGLYPLSYNGACGATLSDDRYGQLKFNLGHEGAAVAFASGLGDGFYPVYATIIEDGLWGRRIAEVKVVMMQEDYEEDCEED